MAEDEKYNFEKTLGIITAWDEFNFDKGENISLLKDTVPRTRTAFTVDDIYTLIRRLKHFIDPKNIERIERLVQRHITDKNNPHDVHIDQIVNTNVMSEIYLDWLAYLNRTKHNGDYSIDELKELYSTEQFLKVLYQRVIIADLETALEGKSTSEVTSVYDVAQMIKRHNEDPEAHGNLLDYLFPGTIHTYNPTFALIADTGVTDNIIVTRNSVQSYMGPDGYMHTSEPNTLAIDWSTGRPAFPIFGETTNYCTHGSVLTNNVFSKINATVTVATEDINNILENEKPFKVSATEDVNTIVHKLTYSIPSEYHANKKTCCISIFAKQGTLDNIGINVYTTIPNDYNCIHYNLSNRMMFTVKEQIDDNIYGRIDELTNGWVRLTYICPAVNISNKLYVDFYLLDIFDGDITFKGSVNDYLYLNGVQIEFDTDVPSPYKSTTGSIVSEDATDILVPINGTYYWYNSYQGGILAEVSNISMISTQSTPRYIFDICDLNKNSIWSMHYPSMHNGRAVVYFANKNNTVAYNVACDRSEDTILKCGSGYCNSGYRQPTTGAVVQLGIMDAVFSKGSGNGDDITMTEVEPDIGDVNRDAINLHIGCQGNSIHFLNGYLYQLIYYPTMTTDGHLRFFLKG